MAREQSSDITHRVQETWVTPEGMRIVEYTPLYRGFIDCPSETGELQRTYFDGRMRVFVIFPEYIKPTASPPEKSRFRRAVDYVIDVCFQ